MAEILLVIWICLSAVAMLGSLMYAGYKGSELSFQDEESLEGLCLTVVALPLILVLGVIASPFLIVWGTGKLIRLGVDKYGRSKKNRA